MRKRIFVYMSIVAVLATFLPVFIIIGMDYKDSGGLNAASAAIFAGIGVFAGGVLLSLYLSKRVVRPIERVSAADMGNVYVELLPLIERIEAQRLSLREGASELEEREHGLKMIVESMQEGLILLDGRGLVLSINKSASKLLNMPDVDFTGKHIFAANPDSLLQASVYTALGGSSCEELIESGGGMIQLMANPVRVEGTVRGVVLLIFDVTEKQAAEQMRREFSANVSHELKTPLTSISGYAEIMKNGLVRPEDVQRFSENIYVEARRLIDLIEDIIRLSRLDEGSLGLSNGDIVLVDIARDVAERLDTKARGYDVTLTVSGDRAVIRGNGQLIEEMIYNLCDNAIKYNRVGGSVEINVDEKSDCVVFSISDTGIGIPKEQQSRVFERFYRVDKSHSKETGGTGLGLSIVKHGAIYHKASVDLESTPGEGTTIRLHFGKSVN